MINTKKELKVIRIPTDTSVEKIHKRFGGKNAKVSCGDGFLLVKYRETDEEYRKRLADHLAFLQYEAKQLKAILE
jgi:hypothetical protein